MSSNYSIRYDKSQFQRTQTITLGRGRSKTEYPILDYLDPALINLVKDMRPTIQHTYTYGEHLANIAYKYHQTTTTKWIIRMINGIGNPLTIKPGTVLLIPSFPEINRAIRDARRLKSLNQTVTI